MTRQVGRSSDAGGLPLWQFTTKDPMTLTINRAVFEITGAHLFIRFAGREVYVSRPTGQPFGMTSGARSGAGLEVWALGFYGVACRGR